MIPHLTTLLMFLLPLTASLAQPPLSSFVNHNRVLIVFAPNSEDPRLQDQLALLMHHGAAMKERDLLLTTSIIHFDPRSSINYQTLLGDSFFTDSTQAETRKRFHIAPGDFTILLIGKDGGEKLRRHTPITIQQLNEVIDAMPMRKDEMRIRKPK
jgi:hypothetical protein